MIHKAIKILLILIVTFIVTLGLALWMSSLIADPYAAMILTSMLGFVCGLTGCIPMLYVIYHD